MIEQHVTSLELSKQLNKLGVKKQSLFVWEYYNENCYATVFAPFAVAPTIMNNYELYPAYLASELGEMLPKHTRIKKRFNDYLCDVSHPKNDSTYYQTVDALLSNCLAKMIIFLIEDCYIKVEDLNK